MVSSKAIAELKKSCEGLTLLYVESNHGLQTKAKLLLEKFFPNVVLASDGEEGYNHFKKIRPQVVLTDISLSKLDGIKMIRLIKNIDPSAKVIITSAIDNKESMMGAIRVGVFDYLKKPLKVDELTDSLLRCVKSIDRDDEGSLFNSYMMDMLNYQSDLLALMSKDKPLFANQMFLDFFGVDTLDDFDLKFSSFGSLLLEHKGFLYDHDDLDWFHEASKEADKIFHAKIADQKGNRRHFILKMHPIPMKDQMYIMSLNDITDLDLLSVFDRKTVESDDNIKGQNTITSLMKIIFSNNSELKIHNFYKGLTITNPGSIVNIKEDGHITIKTSYMQQKAVQYQKSMLLTSNILPNAVLCKSIEKIDFEKQTIIFKDMHFLPRNPTQRKSVRVFPEKKHMVTLFFEERKLYGDVCIHDISIEAVKLETNSLPAGLKEETEVSIDMVLEHEKKPMIIHTPARVIRIEELSRSFFIVLALELTSTHKKYLINYVAKRQMILIREFKGLQFG